LVVNGADIQVSELSLPGTSAADAIEAADAFRREIVRLWQADRDAGIGWPAELGTVSCEISPQLGAGGLGRAIAREVRRHALDRGGAR
jgi:hypothetical protein